MKRCRVFGSSAKCVLSSYYCHGLKPRPSVYTKLAPCVSIVPKSRHIHNGRPKSGEREEWQVRWPRRPSAHRHIPKDPWSPVPIDERLRAVMRLIPHSVVVCTSKSGTQPRGITVSSFNSLSLNPPIVTFHVATPSRTLDAIRESGRVNIHILAGEIEGAKIAHHFATRNLTDTAWQDEELAESGVRLVVREKDAGDEKEPPTLSGPGVLYVLRCKLHERHEGVVTVGDHAIVLGEVTEIVKEPRQQEKFGLVYADRIYRQLGYILARNISKVEL